MTYSDLTAALQTYLVVSPADPDFQVALPRIIEQAELRCYREVDFTATRTYATITLAPGSYSLNGPPDWLIGRYLTLITLGTGVRTELQRREESYLNVLWPTRVSYTVGTPPRVWAELGAGTLLIAPTADASYQLEMAYTFRPAPLSAGNPQTWLSANCPDLLLYAALIAGAGYQKNYGQASDDPRFATSWQEQFNTALANASREEARRKAEAPFDVVTAPPSSLQTRGP